MKVVAVGLLVLLSLAAVHGEESDEVTERKKELSSEELTTAIYELKDVVENLDERLGALEEKVTALKKSGGGGGGGGASVDEKNVVVLSADDFDEKVKAKKFALVEFYAPWCGHCKALAPQFAEAADNLADDEDVMLAKVDCTTDANRDLCSKYDVQGFPTLKLFRDDTATPLSYEEERSAGGIARFIRKQKQPPLTFVSSKDEVDAFAKDSLVKLVLFSSSDDQTVAFTEVAKTYRSEFDFAATTDASVAIAAEQKTGSVVMYRSFDKPAVFEGDVSSDKFVTFLRSEQLPLMGELTMENYKQYYDRGFPFVWMFIDLSNTDQIKLLEDEIKPVAQSTRSRLSFVKMDGIRWAEHSKSLGLSGKTPSFVIEDRESGKNFVFEEDQSVERAAFQRFVDSYLNGELKPKMKSEEIPESNNGDVKIVVGKNWQDIVGDTSKDVLVEFYAPWCGHCKSLAPKYEELGKKFASSPNVVIAKIDATANDAPLSVKGFPTIFLFKAKDKANPIEYSGDRSVEDLHKFIIDNTRSGKEEL